MSKEEAKKEWTQYVKTKVHPDNQLAFIAGMVQYKGALREGIKKTVKAGNMLQSQAYTILDLIESVTPKQ